MCNLASSCFTIQYVTHVSPIPYMSFPLQITRSTHSGGVCCQYQFLLLLLLLCWLSEQPALLLSQQLSSCGLVEVSQGALLVFKESPLHIVAHILNHIHRILWLLIHHLHQQPGEVVITGTLKKDISDRNCNSALV